VIETAKEDLENACSQSLSCEILWGYRVPLLCVSVYGICKSQYHFNTSINVGSTSISVLIKEGGLNLIP
jgi:hypothetical protein